MKSYFMLRTALQVFKTAAGAACMTLGGTAAGCVGALYVERSAHRTLYRFFPHLYLDVEYAFGLEPHLLEELRSVGVGEPIYLHADDAVEWKKNSEWVENHAMYADRTAPISKGSINLTNCAMTS